MSTLDRLLDAITPGRKAIREADAKACVAKADLASAFDAFTAAFEKAGVQGTRDLVPAKETVNDR